MLSAPNLDYCPEDTGVEIAFAGRSNVGKSSVINLLTGNRRLARISKTPGRTQQLNFFSLGEGMRLVDLPGYGYAKVPEKMRQRWGRIMQEYFERRGSLRGVIIIMDIRHPLRPFDQQMLRWCEESNLPAHCVLNKADKVSKSIANQRLTEMKTTLSPKLFSAQLCSTQSGAGKELLQEKILSWLERDSNISLEKDSPGCST